MRARPQLRKCVTRTAPTSWRHAPNGAAMRSILHEAVTNVPRERCFSARTTAFDGKRSFATDNDVLQDATISLTGNGAATRDHVLQAQQHVWRCGGNVIWQGSENSEDDSVGDVAGELVRKRICKIEDWTTVSASIAQSLGLTGQDADALAGASQTNSSTGDSFNQVRAGEHLVSTYTSYRTIRVADSIHCVFGHYQAAAAVEASVEFEPPVDQCVEVNDRTFSVFPPWPKDDDWYRYDMMDKWWNLPVGWTYVDTSTEDFHNLILPQVVAAHYWGTDIVMAWYEDRWRPFKTKMYKNSAGGRAAYSADFFQTDITGRKCVFRGWNARLLIERIPCADLIASWECYVKLKAQSEWSRAVGIEEKMPVQKKKVFMSLADRIRAVSGPSSPSSAVPAAALNTTVARSGMANDSDDDEDNLYEGEDGFDNVD